MEINKKVFIATVLILIAGFVFFIFFSTRISFHDTHEYITVSKELAGIHNVRVHSGHSYVYPFFISIFLKIFPSMQTIKFINFIDDTTKINVFGPVSYYGNGTLWGNDPIGFSWSSDYVISPIAYLSSPTKGSILSKNLPRANASSAKFGESLPADKNLPTGSYKIVVCDEKDVSDPDVLNNPHCGSSAWFTITATTTPFRP